MSDYYMTRPEELAKHAELCRLAGESPMALGSWTTIEAMAGGDAVLFDALWSFWDFEHAFDDLIDESGWDENMIEAAMQALHKEVCRALGFGGESKHVSDWTKTFMALLQGAKWTMERNDLALRAEHKFFSALVQNPLYAQNPGDFRALFTQCIFRCLDGDAMARSEKPYRRQLAPAVKCGDLEVLIHLCYLAHGYVRARVVSAARDYDQPDKEAK